MQEEVEQRTLTLAINGTKFTGRMLKAAVAKFMTYRRNRKKVNVHPKGKQSVKQLTQQGQGVNTMEIDDTNLRQFERIARKYGVDYAVSGTRTPSRRGFSCSSKRVTPTQFQQRSRTF